MPTATRHAVDAAQLMEGDRATLLRPSVPASRRLGLRVRVAAIAAWRRGRDPQAAARAVMDEHLAPMLRDAMLAAFLAGWVRVFQEAAERIEPRRRLGPYDDTIRYWRTRAALTDEQEQELRDRFGDVAVNVTRQTTRAVEKRVRRTVEEIVQQQVHVREGTQRLREAFEAAGVTAETHPMVRRQPHLFETLFRTQTQLAYAAGREQADRDPAIDEITWGYEYVTVGDDRVRPSHAGLHGMRLPKDDARWQTMTPPNGWACRCVRSKIYVDDEPELRRSKEPKPVKDDKGNLVEPGPDKGFAFRPGDMAPQITKPPLVTPVAPAVKPAVAAPPAPKPRPKPKPQPKPRPPKPVAVKPKPAPRPARPKRLEPPVPRAEKPAAPRPPRRAPALEVVKPRDLPLDQAMRENRTAANATRERMEQALRDHQRRIDEASARLRKANDEVSSLRKGGASKEQIAEVGARERELWGEIDTLKRQQSEAVRNALSSDVTDQLAPSLDITGIRGKRADAAGEASDWLSSVWNRPEDMRSLDMRLTGEKGARSWSAGTRIGVGRSSDRGVMVHEMGHWVENQSPHVRRRAQEFLEHRTKGKPKKWLGDKYARTEVGADGGFIERYTAKSYESGSTEIVAMGMEHMYRDPLAFAHKDPEHFQFMVGLLRGGI